jgi:uncharacterized protein with LGFP repeats
MGWERSFLGYPVDAEHDRADALGREQRFERGRIVWSRTAGAHTDSVLFDNGTALNPVEN